MREIKFRAYNVLAGTTTALSRISLPIKTDDGDGHYLMQYTGLKDKNGSEIYGDDLLEDEVGVVFRIYHVYGGFIIKASYWKHNCSDLTPTDELIFEPLSNPQVASWMQSSCEVIGNIHQNPELL